MVETYRLSYYPGITQHVDPAEIARQIQLFAGTVEAALGDGTAIVVEAPMSIPDQIASIAAGRTHIALMNPLGCVFAYQINNAAAPVALATRTVAGVTGEFYYSQLYTNVKTKIASLSDARNQPLAFGSRTSTSNFLVPALGLRNAGQHPLVAFSSVTFFGGHDDVARAIYHGQAALGAGHDGVITDLANQPGYGDAAAVLKQIPPTMSIRSDPITLNVDAARRPQLQKALLEAGNSTAGQAAIAAFWGHANGLVPADIAKYEGLSGALDALRLTRDDILNH